MLATQRIEMDSRFPAFICFCERLRRASVPPEQCALLVLATFSAIENSHCTAQDKVDAKNAALAQMALNIEAISDQLASFPSEASDLQSSYPALRSSTASHRQRP